MKNISKHLGYAVVLLTFSSCDKVIDLDLSPGEALPSMDAWIPDKPGVQTIKFLQAVNYLDQHEPLPITDAEISVVDLTIDKTYHFEYNNGAYHYDPGAGDKIGVIGHQYKLNITYKGEQFEAVDNMK